MSESSFRKLNRIVTVALLAAACLSATASAQNEKRLIRVKDSKGRETALFEKVVVVSSKAALSASPQGSGEPIEPWAIFFRVKNDDGTEKAVNGRLRVGNGSGAPVGWIGQTDVKSWSTRFILDPIEPQRDRAFEVSLEGGGSARQNATPIGKRRYALITDTPAIERGDDTEYPILVYSGNVQELGQSGTLAKQRNELSDVKLEIMFVIESSDFMMSQQSKEDDKPLLDHVKSSIRDLLGELRKDEQIKKAVRLGFSEYKDSVPKAAYVSRLTCDLTDNFDLFSSSLDKMVASNLEDDWPDDVLSGLNEAATKASWSSNSIKHIILLGMASCQLSGRGQNPPQSGANSELEKLLAEQAQKGFNSTGISISQLIARARPQGGADSRARTTRMFHALHFGQDVLSGLTPDERTKLTGAKKIVNEMTRSELNEAAANAELVAAISLIYKLQCWENQRGLALSQYKEISQNNREVDGIFLAVEPGAENVQKAAATLSSKIRETFSILEKVRDGQGLTTTNQNEISQPLFTLVGASAEKFKDSPVLEGSATVRDKRGREVAFKKVMVSEKELRHLRSTLDALVTKLNGKTSKADRQDVGTILDAMKEVLAETSAGQDITANMKLKDLISDLPLRTTALDTTAADLALMTTEAFKEWLEKVKSAIFRIEDLLGSSPEWLTLSAVAVNEKFTFLRLSELP